MKHIIDAKNLTYTYPGTAKPALDSLSLQIPEGKKTVLLGHNGCGKSTFFLHVIGMLTPKNGQIDWKGNPLSYQRKALLDLRQKIGLVFQDPEQQIILPTPFEDISYGLRNAKVSEEEIQDRTEFILRQMGLLEIRDTPIHHLSLGQKKRVALAGVMVLKPELLLLDEPTAYLDRRSLINMLNELNRIHQEGTTILLSTHDMDIAYEWADWVVVMDSGKCVMEGTPLDVFSHTREISEFSLEVPYLFQIWMSIPETFRKKTAPPRTLSELTNLLQTELFH